MVHPLGAAVRQIHPWHSPQRAAFLRQLQTNPVIQGWQAEQAVAALTILYRDFLKILWAADGLTLTEAASPVEPKAVDPPAFRNRGAIRNLPDELLGHADVSTTMIYTHVLNKPGLAVKSPAGLVKER